MLTNGSPIAVSFAKISLLCGFESRYWELSPSYPRYVVAHEIAARLLQDGEARAINDTSLATAPPELVTVNYVIEALVSPPCWASMVAPSASKRVIDGGERRY